MTENRRQSSVGYPTTDRIQDGRRCPTLQGIYTCWLSWHSERRLLGIINLSSDKTRRTYEYNVYAISSCTLSLSGLELVENTLWSQPTVELSCCIAGCCCCLHSYWTPQAIYRGWHAYQLYRRNTRGLILETTIITINACTKL